jgi:NAD(P)-dependent dehydrogenase (short-subunit alcohol dehydrogenase family)
MTDAKRVVLISGASSGFGLVTGAHLTAHGYTVYGAARRPPPAGAPFAGVQMDVESDASVAAAVQSVVRREGRLDAIIANAGMGIAGALEDTSSEEALRQLQVNVLGVHRLCRAALPHLRERPLAHIVIIGSIAGLIGIPFQGMYAASKFALEGYAEALRLELRGGPVRVTILEPGDFATGFTAARVSTAASGPGSPYEAAFAHALKVIENDEQQGADPALIGPAVRQILDDPRPPIRRAVVGPKQEGIEDVKRAYTADQIEEMLAEHFLDEPAPPRP